MSVSALRPSVGCPETPLSSRAAALLPEPAGGVLSPQTDGFKLSPILPLASREAQCGTSLGRCSDSTRILPGAGMGSSQAVAQAVLLDTEWLQWELVTPSSAGSGFCLLPAAASQSVLVPSLGRKTEIVLLDPSQSQ